MSTASLPLTETARALPESVRESLHRHTLAAVRAVLEEQDWNRLHRYERNPGDSWVILLRDLHWFTETLPAGTPLPTMLAERVLAALGFQPGTVVDFVNFYADYEKARVQDALILRALATQASGLPWRTAHCARSGGLSETQIHEWLDVFGAASLEACVRAGMWWHDGELAEILRTRALPDEGTLALLGGLNNCMTRD